MATKFPEIAKDWHPTKNGDLTPSDVVAGTGQRVWWKCPRGHEWPTKVATRTSHGTECPDCTLVHTSKREIRIAFEIYKVFEREYKKNSNVRIGKKTYQLDILLKKEKIVIEYDGSYHHRDKVQLDIRKTEALVDSGFMVIRIREKPLEKITESDILVDDDENYKKVVDKVLLQIQKLLGSEVRGINAYLRKNQRTNKRAADEYIAKLLRDKD